MLRFTVRGPTQRWASPCSHGMPCRVLDIDCRVHVGVGGEAALRDSGLDLAAPVGAALGTGEFVLQPQQPRLFSAAESGRGQQFPGGQGRRDHDTSIHSHHRARARSGDGHWRHGERHMPATRPVTGDPVGLDTLGDRTRPAEPHPTHLGDPHLADIAGYPAQIAQLDCHDPKAFAPLASAPGRAPVGSAEEVRHRLGEVLQRLLLHDHRPGRQPGVRGPSLCQLAALLHDPRRRLASWLPVSVLLYGKVPRTGHAHTAPTTPAPGRGSAEDGIGTCLPTYRPPPTESEDTDGA